MTWRCLVRRSGSKSVAQPGNAAGPLSSSTLTSSPGVKDGGSLTAVTVTSTVAVLGPSSFVTV